MASDRPWRAAARATGVLAAGAAAALAARSGLYATAATAVLAGGWLAALQIAAAGRGGVRLVAPGATPRPDEALLLRAMLDAAPAPLVLLEARGSLRAVNHAARTLFGVDDRLRAPPPELVAALREGRAGERRRLQLAPRGGSPRQYAFSLSEIATAGGPLRVGALLDVQAEVHAAESRSLREVLNVLSHELGNSLTPIASLADSALEALRDTRAADTAAACAALEVIARRSDGLARFVEGYRAVARLPDPRPRLVDVAQLVADVAALVRARPEAARVRITVAVETRPLRRVTDPDLLAQALANLLMNAVEAVQGGDAPQVGVSLAGDAASVVVEVRDNGAGVRAEDADRIFLPLVSTKPQGAGVGLNLARSALRSLGGDLELARSASPTIFRATL